MRPAATRRSRFRTAHRAYALTLPSLLFFLIFFVGPFCSLVYYSFLPYKAGSPIGDTLTLANYQRFLGDPWYWGVLLVSLKLSVIVTAITLAVGFAMAYWLDRRVKRHHGLLIGLLLTPMLVSLVVQSYGWLVLLSPRGIVNSLLLLAGAIERPVKLIFNETGVVIGLTQYILPFTVLSSLTSLQGVDRSLERAAQNLGASDLRTFWRITVPLCMPGIVAGGILAFLLSLTALVTPMLMGGQTVITLPVLAYQQFGQSFNWPFGSATVTLLTAIVLVLLALANRLLRPRRSGAA